MPATLERDGEIAVIRIDHPPVNALSVGAGVVAAIGARLGEALRSPDIAAIVVTGGGALFSAGADIRDFDRDAVELEAIRDLLLAIGRSPKPVAAALRGLALGGGLELALACHHRVAASDTLVALPEITLGLLPGGGGTQRLTRLAGATAALDMMLTGRRVAAREALALGIVDWIADDPVAGAIALLRERGPAPRVADDLPPPADLAQAVAEASSRRLRPAIRRAGRSIVDCVADVALPGAAAGLDAEARRFAELLGSEESAGLRHAFFGRRIVRRIPGLGTVRSAAIERVAVVGGGLMGTGIALALLNADLVVTLIEPIAAARDRARSTIEAALRRDVDKGRLAPDAAAGRRDRLAIADRLDAAATVDLVIEAVFEDMAVKRDVFAALDGIVGPDTILASNTSTLDIDVLAGFTARPERFVGLHFFSPANVMQLLEVVRGARTAPTVLATAMAFAERIGKTGIVAGVCDGFIGNRIFEEYLRQAYFLAEEGATPQAIDAALERWGMAMGPFRTMDLAGQDIGWTIRKRRAIERPDRPYSAFPDRVCELGRFGQKSGRGVYLYADGRTPLVDPEIDDLLVAHSRAIGIERRDVTNDEIVSRCVLAMVNEAAHVVDEGIAYRPVDVDIVYLDGYGFPEERGGPLFHADRLGLDTVLARIDRLAEGRHGWAWTAAPLLRRLATEGGTFAGLNR